MTLVEDIKNSLDDGFEVSDLSLDDKLGVTLIEDEIVDTGRWFIYHRAVFCRAAQYSTGVICAAVEYSEPATEYQDADDEPVEVYAVEPYEITVTKYRKV